MGRLLMPRKSALSSFRIGCVDVPELLYEEHESARLHADALEAEGFRLERSLGGIATAVMGEAGEGAPLSQFLGEYDALPGLSQRAGSDRPEPLVKDGNAMAVATIFWVRVHWLRHGGQGLSGAPWSAGRVRYYGCPAEEGGAAKTFLVRDGYFADVDAALSWHPMSFNGIIPPLTWRSAWSIFISADGRRMPLWPPILDALRWTRSS